MRLPWPRFERCVVIVGLLVTVGWTGCQRVDDGSITSLEFWTCGNEGEVVATLIDEFERENPAIRVKIQQIPWSAAHEKLVTAFAGESLPDLCQLGNTWMPEFVALGALAPLDTRIADSEEINPADYFSGIWRTNQIAERTFGVPWYVDTRLMFYRNDLLKAAGYDEPPTTWEDWQACMTAVQSRMPAGSHAILLPIDEFETPVILGLQATESFLRNGDSLGNFRSESFTVAFEFYANIFRSGNAPIIGATQISNLWQEFADGHYAMYLTGPWNVSQFRTRLPQEQVANWSTAPMPAPTDLRDSLRNTSANAGDTVPGASTAGGCSLVMCKDSPHPDATWKLIEFLSRRKSQIRLFQLLGNLPARREAWSTPELANDPWIDAFRRQLEVAKPTPQVPEWERIAVKIAEAAERVVRGRESIEPVLADLDSQVDAFLEKRRWMLMQAVKQQP